MGARKIESSYITIVRDIMIMTLMTSVWLGAGEGVVVFFRKKYTLQNIKYIFHVVKSVHKINNNKIATVVVVVVLMILCTYLGR